jgi:hypothetical protein
MTVALLLLNVFLSILNTSYKEVRESGRKRRIDIALRKYITDYFRSFYKELMKEFKKVGGKWKMGKKEGDSMRIISNPSQEELWDQCSDTTKIPNGIVHCHSKDDVDNNIQEIAFETEEQYSAAEDVCEEEPFLEFVQNEHPKLLRYLVPLATFDEEDDIIDELSCISDIKMSLKQIERDLLRATTFDDGSSDEDTIDVEPDTKSQESFTVGSTLSVTLSVFENEKPLPERVEKDDISLYSVYSSEEGGVSDEDDEEADLFTAFNSKSGITASMNSINEICAKADQVADPSLLSPHHAVLLNPQTLRW